MHENELCLRWEKNESLLNVTAEDKIPINYKNI